MSRKFVLKCFEPHVLSRNVTGEYQLRVNLILRAGGIVDEIITRWPVVVAAYAAHSVSVLRADNTAICAGCFLFVIAADKEKIRRAH